MCGSFQNSILNGSRWLQGRFVLLNMDMFFSGSRSVDHLEVEKWIGLDWAGFNNEVELENLFCERYHGNIIARWSGWPKTAKQCKLC